MIKLCESWINPEQIDFCVYGFALWEMWCQRWPFCLWPLRYTNGSGESPGESRDHIYSSKASPCTVACSGQLLSCGWAQRFCHCLSGIESGSLYRSTMVDSACRQKNDGWAYWDGWDLEWCVCCFLHVLPWQLHSKHCAKAFANE